MDWFNIAVVVTAFALAWPTTDRMMVEYHKRRWRRQLLDGLEDGLKEYRKSKLTGD
jgi:hypothetical protein